MLEVRDLGVCYRDHWAARGVDFELARGDIGCLLGPSGCGKTTVLRAIAGFLAPSEGRIAVDGHGVASAESQVRPEHRRVGIVLQDLALFPHLDVAANIGFGLPRSHRDRQHRIAELLALTGLAGRERAYPHQLSGGQQQRVAIARAMAPRPRLLLLDEPFSSLDPKLRDSLPRELRRLFKQDEMTVLLVTHDQREAFAMSDRIGVMQGGRLVQWDTGPGLYHRPANPEVAGFIGEGTWLPGQVLDPSRVETALGVLSVGVDRDLAPGAPVRVLIRPDYLVHDDHSPLRLPIVDRTYRGSHFLYTLAVENEGATVMCMASSHHDHPTDGALGVRVEVKDLVVFSLET